MRRLLQLAFAFGLGAAVAYVLVGKKEKPAAPPPPYYPTEAFNLYEVRDGNAQPTHLRPYSVRTEDGRKIELATQPVAGARIYVLNLNGTIAYCEVIN